MIGVLFDLDGTLFDHARAARSGVTRFMSELRHRLDPDEDEPAFQARWYRVTEHWMDRYLAGEMSLVEHQVARMREILGEPGLYEAEALSVFDRYRVAYRQHWQLFPDVERCLHGLEGIPLGILTNGAVEPQNEKARKTGLSAMVDVLVTSGELGVSKPSPRAFEAACERLQLPPERCLYVGDRLDVDARGACGAGLMGVWLNRGSRDRAEDVPTFSNLNEFSGWFQRRFGEVAGTS